MGSIDFRAIIKGIWILESNFNIGEYGLNEDDYFDVDTSYGYEYNTEERELLFTMEVSCSSNRIKDFSLSVGTLAVSEIVEGTPPEDWSSFVGINMCSIVYPFIREHIAGLFAKTGRGTYYLPVMNFQKQYMIREAAKNTRKEQ